jgi:hypothetical protein
MATTYDPMVADLAEHFLQDEPNHGTPIVSKLPRLHAQRVRDLACTIQQAIEDWLDEHPLVVDEPQG